MSKAKEKQIGVEQINGHVPRRNRLITGRAQENTEMLFTSAELSGAMLQQGEDGPARRESSCSDVPTSHRPTRR